MSDQPSDIDEGGFWIFGYGSLIWKPIPDLNGRPSYDQRISGHIRGYVRRFWQASWDHRGTPTSPGRVVTLISHTYWLTLNEPVSHPQINNRTNDDEEKEQQEQPQDTVHGTAYHIPPSQSAAVKAYLDIREMNGYSIEHTTFYPSPSPSSPFPSSSPSTTGRPIPNVMIYIGLPSNPQFLGLQSVDAIARVIATSEGPSGRNVEYLFELEEALKGLGGGKEGRGGVVDGHVRDVAGRVRELLDGEGRGNGRLGREGEMGRVTEGSCGEGDEEVEK